MPRPRKPREIEVVDLFCGIGGLSYGLKTSGFRILAGYDLDGTCEYAYEHNNNANFQYRDIKSEHQQRSNLYILKIPLKF